MEGYDGLTIGDLITHGTFLFEDTPTKRVWLTRDGDRMYVTEEWKNVQALLDENAKYAAEFNQTGSHGELVRLASVPIGLHKQWSKEGITDDPATIARRLNDADNAKLRTNNWRL